MSGKKRPWFRRQWTAHEADEWTREDYWAMLFSSLSYVFFTLGVGLCFLLPLWGFLCVALGILSAFLMYRAIDPKLRKVSEEYESRQKQYLEELDRIMKWEQ